MGYLKAGLLQQGGSRPSAALCTVQTMCLSVARTGVPSDALKVAEYREVLRLRRAMLARGDGAFGGGDDAAYRNFSRVLSKVSGAAAHARVGG